MVWVYGLVIIAMFVSIWICVRTHPRMSYSVIDQAAVDRKRMEKKARKIDGCMVKHPFDYKPGESGICATEFLCDCDNCLNFRFEDCLRKETPLEESMLNESETSNVTTDDCYLDDSIVASMCLNLFQSHRLWL